jgi:hypothetical protein
MKQQSRRPLALTCWLIMITVSLVMWPKPSNAAQAIVRLADSNQSWGNGRFFRTGLAAAEVGGVQLVPTKVLTTWLTSSPLPYGLSQHTSVTYRDRIFVVGGNKVENRELVKTDAFFASRLVPGREGLLEKWVSQTGSAGEATLPALPIRVSDAASVVVEVANKPYLFVLGGQLGEGNLDDVTTANIYSYEIRENGNGQLVSVPWKVANQRLPHEPDFDSAGGGRGSGARNISALPITIDGQPYIYLFGGWNRTYIGGSYYDEYFSTVYRSRVTAGNNGPDLGAWEAVGNIRGLYNGSVRDVPLAGASTVSFTDPADGTTAVYLIGGSNANNEYDANAYIVKINPNDPAAPLQWLDNGNMSETRVGHDAVQAKGSITVSGGSLNAELPSQSLARGFIMDDFTLYRPFENAANFELTQGALSQARMYHTMETLKDAQNGKDYAYIIGGKVQIDQATQDPASQQVLVGDLDEQPRETDSFVADGKYYSKIFDFGQDAEYFSLTWTTIMSTGEDIDMQYRIGNDAQSMGAAISLPITPLPGKNTYTHTFSPPEKARYFQFVATLKSSPLNRKSSPVLDKVSLEVKRVGFPNIRFAAQEGASFVPNPIDTSNTTITPIVKILNQDFDAAHQSLDADWDAPGTFFVDIYVTPGTTAPKPQLGQIGVAWAEISKSLMKADMDAPYTIPSTSWRPGSCTSNCSTMNWRNIFTSVGTYTVYVMVDSTDDRSSQFGNIQESDASGTLGENDNVFGPFTVTVNEIVDLRIFVPMTMTPPAPGVTNQTAPALPRRRVHTIGDSQ